MTLLAMLSSYICACVKVNESVICCSFVDALCTRILLWGIDVCVDNYSLLWVISIQCQAITSHDCICHHDNLVETWNINWDTFKCLLFHFDDILSFIFHVYKVVACGQLTLHPPTHKVSGHWWHVQSISDPYPPHLRDTTKCRPGQPVYCVG